MRRRQAMLNFNNTIILGESLIAGYDKNVFRLDLCILCASDTVARVGAQFNVKSTYTKYASQPNYARLTGREAAQLVLMQHGITGVNIRYIEGDALTNYFDPRSNEIVLSRSVCDSSSVSAIGIAAHEAGHACTVCAKLCAYESARRDYSGDADRLEFGFSACVARNYIFVLPAHLCRAAFVQHGCDFPACYAACRV